MISFASVHVSSIYFVAHQSEDDTFSKFDERDATFVIDEHHTRTTEGVTFLHNISEL